MSRGAPPEARRGAWFVEAGGRRFVDPYRWMEADTQPRRAWLQAHQEHAAAVLSALPARAWIRRRIAALMPSCGPGRSVVGGRRSFFLQCASGRDLASLYCRDHPAGKALLLFDPCAADPGLPATVADIHPSPDGSRVAFRISAAGTSLMPLLVADAASGEILRDGVPGEVNPVAHAWHTANRVAWLPDSSGFYYTRCPAGTPPAQRRYGHKLYFHRIGSDWTGDRLVFGDDLEAEQAPFPLLSDDGRYLLAVVQDMAGGRPRSALHLLDRRRAAERFVRVCPRSAGFASAVLHGEALYVRTDHRAPRGRILRIELAAAARGDSRAKTVVPEAAHPIGTWTTAGERLVVEFIEETGSRLRVYRLDGRFVKAVALPRLGTVGAIRTAAGSAGVRFRFSSFLMPGADFRLSPDGRYRRSGKGRRPPFDPDAFTASRVLVGSEDGTSVPMYLLHRRDVGPNGSNPAVLYGYGGFGVSMRPKFTPHVIPFLERGGVYAVVCARGGGERGEAWHWAGCRSNKRNTFDDFIAAGEWLVARGYAHRSRLACFGWSNGGLTVHASAVRRPGLWCALVAGSPVTDMARFDMAYGGRLWVGDYGSPADPGDLAVLMGYSPYHALPDRVDGPAVLTIVPDRDDRVAPWHGYKMHAAWLASNRSGNPVLLRGEPDAGHRGAAAVGRTVDMYADIWAFLFWRLGMTAPPSHEGDSGAAGSGLGQGRR